MLLNHGSHLNRNEVSHSPCVPDRMWNSKLYPVSKHRGDERNGMLRNGDENGNCGGAGVGITKRGNQTKTPWRLNG
jgi:hypothetical protein